MSLQEKVHASYGITSYVDTSLKTAPVSFHDPYYETSTHRRFMETMQEKAQVAGVDIRSTHRAVGLYEGTQEPSVAVNATGFRSDIEDIASHLLEEFSQRAVHIIFQPGHGMHRLYRFNIESNQIEIIMSRLASLRITGARITNGMLELSDIDCIPSHILAELEKLYGSATVFPCEIVQIHGN